MNKINQQPILPVGGMLTGVAIAEAVEKGDIVITPYDQNKINPNSYNLTLDKDIKIYDFQKNTDKVRLNNYLDSHQDNPTKPVTVHPDNSIYLQPGVLYIGRTVERTFSNKYIPMINGRSSGGRLGLSVHICAGFGDIGFDGTWTLEITVVHPLIIYAGDEIAQICFFTPYGDTSYQYKGRYQHQIDATASRFSHDKEYSITDILKDIEERKKYKYIYNKIIEIYGSTSMINMCIYGPNSCTISDSLNTEEVLDSDNYIFTTEETDGGIRLSSMVGRMFVIEGKRYYVRKK